MADNTTLNSGAGGDVIRTDELIDDTSKLPVAKAQVVKLMTGGDGIDGGLVGAANPLPVADRQVLRMLEKISHQLDELIETLNNL